MKKPHYLLALSMQDPHRQRTIILSSCLHRNAIRGNFVRKVIIKLLIFSEPFATALLVSCFVALRVSLLTTSWPPFKRLQIIALANILLPPAYHFALPSKMLLSKFLGYVGAIYGWHSITPIDVCFRKTHQSIIVNKESWERNWINGAYYWLFPDIFLFFRFYSKSY